MICKCCLEEEEEVRYRDKPDGKWMVCIYCEECVKYMLNTQFKNYIEQVKNEKCKKSLERLISMGPPENFRDPKVFCDNERNEVYAFENFSAKVERNCSKEELKEYFEFVSNISKLKNDLKNNF